MSQPTLLGIQTLIILGPYLSNSGRFLDAWTLFGTTIRMAYCLNLHRDSRFLETMPSLRECATRRTLWWSMLHMDQQYSITLVRPLGISDIGDCPPPLPLTTNRQVVRLEEVVNHFTVLTRQILSNDGTLSIAKIDHYTNELLSLCLTMPEALQFNDSWANVETTLLDLSLYVTSACAYFWKSSRTYS